MVDLLRPVCSLEVTALSHLPPLNGEPNRLVLAVINGCQRGEPWVLKEAEWR